MAKLPFKNIGVEEAQKLIEEGKLKVIDVRQDYEYKGGHIKGATLIPINGLSAFAAGLEEQAIAREEPILFVCEMGQRSIAASEVAAIAGYQAIYNLEGGMNSWRYAGMPIVKK
ncbi:MAG: rhodanese-like domain-containing protein [Chloroflexota bacterium]|nr:rhodanese-like domain-containing protein [Chloroflexota bacterium]